jgi:hypothetical protein
MKEFIMTKYYIIECYPELILTSDKKLNQLAYMLPIYHTDKEINQIIVDDIDTLPENININIEKYGTINYDNEWFNKIRITIEFKNNLDEILWFLKQD